MPDSIKERLDAMKERGTPNPDGTCKEEGCGGRIVKDVISMSCNGRFDYWTPYCEKCKRVYLFAKKAVPVGGTEFLEKLRTPFTI